MVAHEERASMFQLAITQRIAGRSDIVVLDIGTGPFALLALIAARAGAKRVYAIEASSWAARAARSCVALATAVPPGVVTIIEGLSTE
jgi:predicted RNA methylase